MDAREKLEQILAQMTSEQKVRAEKLLKQTNAPLAAIEKAVGELVRLAVREKVAYQEQVPPSAVTEFVIGLAANATQRGINKAIVELDDAGELDFFKSTESGEQPTSGLEKMLSRLLN